MYLLYTLSPKSQYLKRVESEILRENGGFGVVGGGFLEKMLTFWGEWLILGIVIPGSSMVEQEAVNFEVAGSSPAPGAIWEESLLGFVFCM